MQHLLSFFRYGKPMRACRRLADYRGQQVGSFENKIGSFDARDTYEQKHIIVQFRWDASNPDAPI